MESKEKWIENVLASTTSVESIDHNPFLYRKTCNAMKEGQATEYKKQWLAPIFGCFAFLIFLNSFMVYTYQDNSVVFDDDDINLIMEEYAMNEEEISLY